MTWHRLGAGKIDDVNAPAYSDGRRTYYERHPAVADGRLGIGFRF